MGFFSTIFGDSSSRPSAHDDFWYQGGSSGFAAGQSVTAERVLEIPIVLACLQVVAETIATLPIGVFQRQGDGQKKAEFNHPLMLLLNEQPNSEHTAAEFREILLTHMALRGSGYAEIVSSRRAGSVAELIPLHPDNVRPVRVVDSSGRHQYQYDIIEPGARTRRVMSSDLFKLRSRLLGLESIVGVDLVEANKDTFGQALALQAFASRFFKNDATPPFGIKVPNRFKTEDDKTNFLDGWRRRYGGKNRGTPALFEYGTEPIAITQTNEQAQFAEVAKRSDQTIARLFRVQPHKVGLMDDATFSNIEHQGLEFVTDTVGPPCVRFEQAAKRDLITRPDLVIRHNVKSLLRGDIESRFSAYAQGRQWGWQSVNEIRKEEGLNPIDGGDEYIKPLNMEPTNSNPKRSRDERSAPNERTENPEPKLWKVS
jgi:HK97 family phage portal protein